MHSTDHRCNCAVTAENLVSCCRYLLEPGCTSGVLGGHLGEVNFLRNYVKQVSEPRSCKCQVRLPWPYLERYKSSEVGDYSALQPLVYRLLPQLHNAIWKPGAGELNVSIYLCIRVCIHPFLSHLFLDLFYIYSDFDLCQCFLLVEKSDLFINALVYVQAVGASWASSSSVYHISCWLCVLSKNYICVLKQQGHPGKEGPAGEKGAQVSQNVDLPNVPPCIIKSYRFY